MKSIVVGYDGSESARRALDRAAELSGDGTPVSLVGAAPMRMTSVGPLEPDPEDVERHQRQLDEARAYLAGKGVEARVSGRHGDAAEALIDEVNDAGADLIVVGSSRKSLPKRVALGSVSSKVVHRAPCDVLVVR